MDTKFKLHSAKIKNGRGAIRGRFVWMEGSGDACRLTLNRYLVISTSLVSGRNKKPTTRLIRAIAIGYHRPE